jgi:hypothetical protein
MSTDSHPPGPLVSTSSLPVAVIGAGPIGLVAAAHLVEAGETPLLFEAGPSVGTSVREWGHVRLFSPWKYLIDPVAAGLLQREGWARPDPEHLPTGKELVEVLLEPLGDHPTLRPHIRFGRTVEGVSRQGLDKVKSSGRNDTPFQVITRAADGTTERSLVRAVIDASGTWTTPNPIGAGGLPVPGEREHGDRIRYGIPDVLARDREEYAGRRTLVIGSGHSAFNAILDLVRLRENEPATEILWAVRRDEPGLMFGASTRDALPARGNLGARLKDLVDSGQVAFVTGFRTESVRSNGDGRLEIQGEGDRLIGSVDRIVATTGFRPDLSLLRELRVELDPLLEAPTRLAPMIDPNLHSCGTVRPHGYEELKHPETDAYVVGMKSYGRAPTFLMLTGYEQVRSVVAGLTGDMESAREVRLTLPETGVCSSDLPVVDCCGGKTSDSRELLQA